MARDENPAVSAPFPVVVDPHGAWMRWLHPMAVNPNVVVAIPAMVALDPYPSVMRWMVMILGNRRRRRNPDDDLRQCNRGSETQSEQPCQKSLFHRNHYLRGSDLPESGSFFLAINDNNPRAGESLQCSKKNSPWESFPSD